MERTDNRTAAWIFEEANEELWKMGGAMAFGDLEEARLAYARYRSLTKPFREEVDEMLDREVRDRTFSRHT